MSQPKRRRKARQLDPANAPPNDLLLFEKALFSEGFRLVAGVDEAGRGPLAGPVVAAAVVLPPSCSLPGLNDSKQLSKARREYFFDAICSCAQGWAVGAVDSCEIDRMNILRASLEAMRIAVTGLGLEPEILLIDGPFKIDHPLPQRAIKRGDSLSLSIAAASVVAKVTRDRIMCEFENSYPEFSFSVHKGYGTARHLEELRRHGPTPIHRLTFRGVGI